MKKFFTSMVLFLSAVTLSAATAATEPTDTKTVVATLLNTPQSVGSWSNTIEVAGSLLSEAGAKAGDFLRVTYTVTEEGAQLQLCANVPKWYNIYPCTDVASSEKYVELQLTAEMIENIVADKLYIQGKQLTVDCVQLVRDGVEDGVHYDLTVGDAKYATLVLPFDCELPTGVKAYTLTGVDEANYVNCKEVTGTLAKNTPVLVSAEKGTYTFVATAAPDAADAPASGLLTGVWEETAVPTGAYVLQNKNENVAFYKVSADDYKIKANRAYLSLPSNAKTLMLNFDGETTGIGSIVPSFNNAADAPCYNLNGVRVNSSAPGLIIKNGKKFINK